MERVFALIDSGHNEDGTMFDPKADEQEYYNKCDEAFNDKIVGAVVAETEPSYGDDEYKWIDHKDPIYDRIYKVVVRCCWSYASQENGTRS